MKTLYLSRGMHTKREDGVNPSRLFSTRLNVDPRVMREDVLRRVAKIAERQLDVGCTGCGVPFLTAHEELGLVAGWHLRTAWELVPWGKPGVFKIKVYVLCESCDARARILS